MVLNNYVRKRGKWTANGVDYGIDLVATSSQGDIVSLKRLQAHEASKILGVQLAPNGDNKKLVTKLKQVILQKKKLGLHYSQTSRLA